MTRGGKTALNLGLCVLFLLWVLGMFGYPQPTARMEFRRLERENLMAKSEIVWQLDAKRNILTGRFHQLADIFVGQTEDRWVGGYLYWDRPDWYSPAAAYLESWTLEDGPTPVPLSMLISEPDEAGQLSTGNAMLFLQVPEEAARAVVQVTGRSDAEVDRRSGTGRTENFEGEAQGNGVFYFWMGPNLPQVDGNRLTGGNDLFGLPYTLELYRADDSLLLEQAGTIPEP